MEDERKTQDDPMSDDDLVGKADEDDEFDDADEAEEDEDEQEENVDEP